MAFIKLVIFGFIAMTVIYWSIALYARSVRKENLEKSFDAANPGSTDRAARDAFVSAGMQAYNASIRPKLLGLVYVVPTIVIGSIVYTINMN
ncbi:MULTISPECIES: hypothetical protein [unclassified Yoonia]|uniref:hypothetical protein n=1 Tax=unclassified Yoonia TaxID=2629118 RepID=UPI002AFE273C|nr:MULTISPECIES: hypothetical protein [unclassified Yoonia]